MVGRGLKATMPAGDRLVRGWGWSGRAPQRVEISLENRGWRECPRVARSKGGPPGSRWTGGRHAPSQIVRPLGVDGSRDFARADRGGDDRLGRVAPVTGWRRSAARSTHGAVGRRSAHPQDPFVVDPSPACGGACRHGDDPDDGTGVGGVAAAATGGAAAGPGCRDALAPGCGGGVRGDAAGTDTSGGQPPRHPPADDSRDRVSARCLPA